MADPRFHARIPARFELGGWKAEGRIENFAEGGVFVGTSTIPRRGEKVWLEFEAPGGGAVEATGVVWWTTLDRGQVRGERKGFGVRLVGASPGYRDLLRRLCAPGKGRQ